MGKTEMWICTICEYVYDPFVGDIDNGIEAGTSFEDLPDYWTCPSCGLDKDIFIPFVEHAEFDVMDN